MVTAAVDVTRCLLQLFSTYLKLWCAQMLLLVERQLLAFIKIFNNFNLNSPFFHIYVHAGSSETIMRRKLQDQVELKSDK